MTRFVLPALAAVFVLSACDTTDPDPQPVPLNVQTATDINADYGPRDPSTGQVQSTGRFALYSLREGRLVLGVDNANRADSNSTAWDIGFRGTTIIFNGGVSGPGQAQAQLLTEAFAAVTEAPASGYVADGANTTCPPVQTPGGPVPGSTLVICTGAGNGWYTYNPFPTGGGYITPTAGRTIVVRTAGGAGYSKVRILSYYRGNPDPATITPATEERFYTFEFVTQTDGSRSFTTTTATP